MVRPRKVSRGGGGHVGVQGRKSTGAREEALNVRGRQEAGQGSRVRTRGAGARVVNETFRQTCRQTKAQEENAMGQEDEVRREAVDKTRQNGNEGNAQNAPNLANQLYQDFHDAVQQMTRSSHQETRASAAIRQFQRMEPKEFKGEGDPLLAEEWIINCERIFDVIELAEDDLKVKSAKFYLKEEAGRWWTNMEEVSKVGSVTWKEFKTMFLEEYFPQEAQNKKRREFMDLIQGGLTVDQYIQKFNKLSRYGTELVATEDLKCRKFEEGLPLKLQELVAAQRLSSFSELVKTARRVEWLSEDRQRIVAGVRGNTSEASSSRGGYNRGVGSDYHQRQGTSIQERRGANRLTPSVGSFSSPTALSSVREMSTTSVSSGPEGTCFNCGLSGHYFYRCPNLECLQCGGKGHLRNECSSGRSRLRHSSQAIAAPPPAGTRSLQIEPSTSALSSRAVVPHRGGYRGRGRGGARQSEFSQGRVYALSHESNKESRN